MIEQKILPIFAQILKNNSIIGKQKQAFLSMKIDNDIKLGTLENENTELRLQIIQLMNNANIHEVTLPDDIMNIKIIYRKGVEKVIVPDVEALPDEFVKIEKTAKKQELLAMLKAKREAGEALPNYAIIERGESTLDYKAVKKQ